MVPTQGGDFPIGMCLFYVLLLLPGQNTTMLAHQQL